ncbi:TIM-barrel domain-containing protein [Hymenobacter sp. DG01]|uniref:TIM-barrel domain-containing protein n=1 Tax=Hymenobacter sp. DG01 TaxID=2584940 RepID=UPI00112316BA|nr:TIM-barrel domain-containing protein [Hymenobacter sp. DG01]
MAYLFRCFRLLPFLLLPPLLSAYGQRTAGGPPTQDPFARPVAPAASRTAIGNYGSHSYDKGILTIKSTTGATLRLRPWAVGVVRVEYFPAGQPVQDISSVSVVQAPQPWHPPGTHHEGPEPGMPARFYQQWAEGLVRATPTILEWKTDRTVTFTVQKNPLRVSCSQNGKTLLRETDGVFQQPAVGSTPGGTGVSFQLAPEEHLYGTGSRALPLDRRGRRLTLYNEARYGYQNGESTLNVSLPTVVSSRGYMLFFDNHAPGTLDLGATDKNTLEYTGEGLTNLGYFIVSGRSYAEILDRYTALTGRQPLPPRWALGLIQSRFGYRSEQEMYQVARRMRRAGFPLDALVLDLYWFGGTSRQGDFQWQQPHFPDPARLMRRLDSAGVKTILISEPYVMRASINDSLVRRQGLVGRDTLGRPYTVASFWAGPATLLDMFRPQTQHWLWQQYNRLKQDGVGGWWSDLGEPENQPTDMVYDPGPTRRIHNAYGQAWASILQEGYTQNYPQERLFNLARSGWAGMQRNSVFPWSGDVSRSWSGLQAQVPIMLSMGLGGVGYMHSDAGGFAGNTVDPELYTRWLQMASLGPILRPHGAGTPPEPYWFPEPYQSYVREATHLRYQLLPYLYTLAWENSQTGTPLTRPMNYGAPSFSTAPAPSPNWDPTPLTAEEREAGFTDEDLANPDEWRAPLISSPAQRSWLPTEMNTPALANLNDQFMLGPNLLVAPVLQPGQRRRNVVLPAGSWVDFYTHETVPGGATVGRSALLARIPVLARAGAIVPMAPYVSSTALYRADTLRLRYYADPDVVHSSFSLYEDDGKSGARMQRQAYQLLSFTGSNLPDLTTFSVTPRGPGYEGEPATRVIELLIPRVAAPPQAVRIGEQDLTDWQFDSLRHTLRLRFAVGRRSVGLSIAGLRLNTAPAPNLSPEILTLEAPGNRTFGGSTELRYTLHQPGPAGALQIFNAHGQLVRTFPTANQAGPHTLIWNADDAQGRPVPSGVYRVELAGQHQRLLVIR